MEVVMIEETKKHIGALIGIFIGFVVSCFIVTPLWALGFILILSIGYFARCLIEKL
jgi:hypothetical protein